MNMKCTITVLSVLVALTISTKAFGGSADPYGGPCPPGEYVFLNGYYGDGRAWELTKGFQVKLKSVGKLNHVSAFLVIRPGPYGYIPSTGQGLQTFCGLR